MFGSDHRFKGNRSVRYVLRKGRSVRDGPFQLKFAQTTNSNKSRYAVIVSKKVSKQAVARNRIRRRVYESLRALHTEQKPAMDIIVTVYSDSVLKTSAGELSEQLQALLDRAYAK